MKSSAAFTSLLSLFFCMIFFAPAAQTQSTLTLEPVATGLSSPIFVTHASDGTNRLFIVEQTGAIKVLQPGASTPAVFLNIASKIVSGGERGLLGLAFHPNYETNRRFLVNYTRAGDGATVIAEYRASASNPNIADTAETIFLVIPQPFTNHNGGMMAFGPDGFLYIATGDGGSANDPGNRAQNINELLGKILRIDVDTPNGAVPYSSPVSNPFFGSTPGRDEIYAFGLRNPWRFSFDRLTGELYAGDVGQNAREEIDIIVLGGNYGWRVFEGTLCTNLDPSLCGLPGFVAPIHEYSHAGGRCSVTGGYVYRGNQSTFALGTYLFGDFCTGEIFQRQNGVVSLLRDTTFNIASFGEDEAGELYVVDLGGAVYRFERADSPPPPPPPCTFEVAASPLSFPAQGGTGSATVTAPAGCAWSASSNASWIRITSGATGSGNGTVSYTVDANGTTKSRGATLVVAGQSLTITQAAGSATTCVTGLTPSSRAIDAAGGSGLIAVSAPTNCSWTATSEAAFITITGGASGTGTGKVIYSVAANPTTATRTGTINIGGRTFTVTQTGAACSFSLATTSATFGAAGGSGGVSVIAPAGCAWTATSNAPFLHITTGSGAGSGTAAYTVDANPSPASRSGTMTIAGITFTVTQSGTGAGCTIVLSPTSASFSASGGTGSFNVTAPSGCGWTAASEAGFITITGGAAGSGNGTVSFSVASNPGGTRSGTIRVNGQPFTVTQSGAVSSCSFTISPMSIIYSASGGSGSISVTTQSGCAWAATSDASWLRVTSGASGSGNGTVNYTVAPNTTGVPRTGRITIGNRALTVKQR